MDVSLRQALGQAVRPDPPEAKGPAMSGASALGHAACPARETGRRDHPTLWPPRDAPKRIVQCRRMRIASRDDDARAGPQGAANALA
ncbi:MAG: hypothetical protein WBC53_02530, partial [Phycisphaerae bacterium]